MQNKANFHNAQMNVCSAITMDYVNIRLRSRFKNKPKQTQFKPNFRKAKMNVNSILTKDYERNDIFAVPQNKANSNPIQSQFKPNQTQFFALSILPMLPIHPNQAQFQTRIAKRFQQNNQLSTIDNQSFLPTPACRGEASGEDGSTIFHQ